MAGRVDHGQDLVAHRDLVAMREWFPVDGGRPIHPRPKDFLQPDSRMRYLQCRRAARMIRVAVGHEHSHELSRVSRKLGFERREMARIADTRINEDRLTIGTDEQVGVVAAAGHRAGIVRREANRRYHRLKTIADAENDM